MSVSLGYNILTMNNIIPLKYTTDYPTMQLKMNLSTETYLPDDSKVFLVCNIVDNMDLEPILCTLSRKGRKPAVDPVTMLKIMLFSYSTGIYSCRKIEEFCKYDIRAMYILGGRSAPDHSTICRFFHLIEDHTEGILTQFVMMLLEDGHVDLKSIYIDGTKIESFAGRYTFVWRKATEKYCEKLRLRTAMELGLDGNTPLEEVKGTLRHRFNQVRNECKKQKIVFVHGIGKRKTELQRQYEYFDEVLTKFSKYSEYLEIMGDRNSFSKTDPDATFMRMKDDHMRNGQLKPAYNIQAASNGAFIVGVMGINRANDLNALVPFVNQLMGPYSGYMERIVADAGYESEENYLFLRDKNLESYIKPANYEQKKTRKFKKDIGRRENMKYLEKSDAYLCADNKLLIRQRDRNQKTITGYIKTTREYRCFDCTDCSLKKECIKSRKENPTYFSKTIRFSQTFEEMREISQKNIMSDEGIEERINRSIQAEGVFSKMKDGMNYVRFRHRSMKKVVADTILVALGININKLDSKLKSAREGLIKYKKPA